MSAKTDLARRRRAEAAALTGKALGGSPRFAAAALAARAEARLATRVASYTAPVLEPSGELPFGPARGALETAAIPEIGFDPATGADLVVDARVRRRRPSRALADLPDHLVAAAAIYADAVERVAAPGCPGLDAPRAGGVSDGGAVRRTGLAQYLGSLAAAVGSGVVLDPYDPGCYAVAGRRALTALDLVNRVCVDGWVIDQVLASRGWSRRTAYRNRATAALRAALVRVAEVL